MECLRLWGSRASATEGWLAGCEDTLEPAVGRKGILAEFSKSLIDSEMLGWIIIGFYYYIIFLFLNCYTCLFLHFLFLHLYIITIRFIPQ